MFGLPAVRYTQKVILLYNCVLGDTIIQKIKILQKTSLNDQYNYKTHYTFKNKKYLEKVT